MHTSFSYIDAILMVICLLFALGGFQKGFTAQISQLITFIFSAIGLFVVYPFLFSLAQDSFKYVSDTYIMWILLAIFLVVGLIIHIAVSKILMMSHPSQYTERTDRAVGMLFGMFRGVFIVFFLLIFVVMLAPAQSYKIMHDKSGIGRVVCDELIPQIQPHMTPANFNEKIRRARTKLRNNKEGGFYNR